jgi:hypothetical protein
MFMNPVKVLQIHIMKNEMIQNGVEKNNLKKVKS